MKRQRLMSSRTLTSQFATALWVALLGAAYVSAGGSTTRSDGLIEWKTGQTLTAADLNGNFAAVDARLRALESSWAKVTGWERVDSSLRVGGTPATNAVVNAWQRRIGDTAEIRIEALTTTSPMNGANILSGNITWTLPKGISMDMTKGGRGIVGVVNISSSVTENYLCHALIVSEGTEIYG